LLFVIKQLRRAFILGNEVAATDCGARRPHRLTCTQQPI
jgi:hypothetical protein